MGIRPRRGNPPDTMEQQTGTPGAEGKERPSGDEETRPTTEQKPGTPGVGDNERPSGDEKPARHGAPRCKARKRDTLDGGRRNDR